MLINYFSENKLKRLLNKGCFIFNCELLSLLCLFNDQNGFYGMGWLLLFFAWAGWEECLRMCCFVICKECRIIECFRGKGHRRSFCSRVIWLFISYALSRWNTGTMHLFLLIPSSSDSTVKESQSHSHFYVSIRY